MMCAERGQSTNDLLKRGTDQMTTTNHQHGANLARIIGGGQRFISATVITGSSMSEGEETMIAVYPEEFHGMGGGMMMASMQGAPVYEFAEGSEDQAKEMVEALNYFAKQGQH